MNKITQVEDILEYLTSYSITQGTIHSDDKGIWIQHGESYRSRLSTEIFYYNVIIHETTLDLLESKRTAFLKVKNTMDYDPSEWQQGGSINVNDGSSFDIDDDVTGATSGATGTIYKIDTNILYLKNVTGTWQSGETISDGDDSSSTTSSTLTSWTFPHWMKVDIKREDYDIEYNGNVGGDFFLWLEYEAGWSLT